MQSDEQFRLGDWKFIVARNVLRHQGGREIKIEDRAARVLYQLCRHGGHVVSKRELIDQVWHGRSISAHSIAVVISDLRKALGDNAQSPQYIETVSKRGYRLLPGAELNRRNSDRIERRSQAGQLLGPSNPGIRLIGLAGAAVLLMIGIGLILFAFTDRTDDQPPTIITLNNVTNATGDPALDTIATAFTEIGAARLAQTRQHILIRDRWDFDADDPSLGLFDDFDRNAQVYHVTGKIVMKDELPAIALFADNPKTGSIVWSDSFSFTRSSFSDRLQSSLNAFIAFLDQG